MRYIRRNLDKVIQQATRHFPAVVVTGRAAPERRLSSANCFPRLSMCSLRILTSGRIRNDPRTFLEELRPPVLFDEIQNAPNSSVMCALSSMRRHDGWTVAIHRIAGSAVNARHHGIDGRPGCHTATSTFQCRRDCKSDMLHGGFPEVLARQNSSTLVCFYFKPIWSETSVQLRTYETSTFRRFLGCWLVRHGQILNKTDLAAPLGVSVPTIGECCRFSNHQSGHPCSAYFENLGKRLIKIAKLYWGDPACLLSLGNCFGC